MVTLFQDERVDAMAIKLQELLDHQAALERQIIELRQASRSGAIAAVKALMAQHGVTAADLGTTPQAGQRGAASKVGGAKVAPKFRHPASGATWTGRGLKPRWLTQELANGRSKADFAI